MAAFDMNSVNAPVEARGLQLALSNHCKAALLFDNQA